MKIINKTPRKFFCTFADRRLYRSLNRISKQAHLMNVYDSIHVFNETNLDQKFQNYFAQYLKPGIRGFGYWCWKPQIILQVLEQMENGDLLQYCDSGCHLNPKGRQRLFEYFEKVSNSEFGIVAFRSKSVEEKEEIDINPVILEYQYTKGDLFDFFRVSNNSSITHSPQYQGGIIFIRKDDSTVDFVKKWLNVVTYNFRLIDDSPSMVPNFAGFIEHRHDQSIFSILCKLSNVSFFYTSEYFSQNDWEDLNDKPIWVKWDKDFGIFERLRNFVTRIFIRYFKVWSSFQ